jgi:hypothetical protein
LGLHKLMVKRLCLLMAAVLTLALGPYMAAAAASKPSAKQAVNLNVKDSRFILSTGYRVDDVD